MNKKLSTSHSFGVNSTKSERFTLRSKTTKGFTLVELLVVISIIAILSTLGMVAYSAVQGRGRDSVRRAVLNNIANATEARRNSNGTYIFTNNNLNSEFPDDTNAKIGLDPSTYPYCINATTAGASPPPTDTWATSPTGYAGCPASPNGWDTFGNLVKSGGALNAGTVTSWTICARLEAGGTTFCRSSLTR